MVGCCVTLVNVHYFTGLWNPLWFKLAPLIRVELLRYRKPAKISSVNFWATVVILPLGVSSISWSSRLQLRHMNYHWCSKGVVQVYPLLWPALIVPNGTLLLGAAVFLVAQLASTSMTSSYICLLSWLLESFPQPWPCLMSYLLLGAPYISRWSIFLASMDKNVEENRQQPIAHKKNGTTLLIY